MPFNLILAGAFLYTVRFLLSLIPIAVLVVYVYNLYLFYNATDKDVKARHPFILSPDARNMVYAGFISGLLLTNLPLSNQMFYFGASVSNYLYILPVFTFAVFLFFVPRSQLAKNMKWGTLLVIIGCYGFSQSVFNNLNEILHSAPEYIYKPVLVKKSEVPDKLLFINTTANRIELSPFADSKTNMSYIVDNDTYNAYKQGDTVSAYIRHGFLDTWWVSFQPTR
ncbi:MAG: hypothetical protein V4543_11720 [Bacteroidota bacterium]